MKIAIGNDHAAVELKKKIIEHLEELGHDCMDLGAQEGEKCDYPVPGRAVAEAVVKCEAERGILICGTGIGISIAANKVKGIRAAVCSDVFSARLCVEHNNCQILAFGSRVVGEGLAYDLTDAFLNAVPLGGRHEKRVQMIMDIENEKDA